MIASLWQPIETAPKDGTAILVFVPRFARTIVTFHDGEWWEGWFGAPPDEGGISVHKPTHWMPLPDPPVLA